MNRSHSSFEKPPPKIRQNSTKFTIWNLFSSWISPVENPAERCAPLGVCKAKRRRLEQPAGVSWLSGIVEDFGIVFRHLPPFKKYNTHSSKLFFLQRGVINFPKSEMAAIWHDFLEPIAGDSEADHGTCARGPLQPGPEWEEWEKGFLQSFRGEEWRKKDESSIMPANQKKCLKMLNWFA